MELVEGQSNRAGLTVELKEGRLKVYSISEAKLRLFRDGGTLAGRLNDATYTLFTCAVSFLVACLTTNSDVFMYVLATLTIVFFAASIALFFLTRNKKNELSILYDEVVIGEA